MKDDLELLLAQALERNGRTPPVPANLREAMSYSLFAPGKRIRPRLVLACGRMLGLTDAVLLPPALALEMLHCCTLIHDDLPCMDNDDFRRGKPSNHKVFGEALALLAGDSLLVLAMDTLLEAAPHTARFVEGLKVYLDATGPRGVMGGQAAEMLLTADSKIQDLRTMHRMKTGALFEASIQIPAAFAGITLESREGQALQAFSMHLGLGFQAMDDLEDTLQDLKLGKQQIPFTSILKYQTPVQVAESTLELLEGSMQEVRVIWGEGAAPLLKIAGEVAAKIREYGGI